jgi:hypothetical protein
VLLPAYLGYIMVGRENPDLSEQTVWRGLAQVPTVIPWGLLGYLAPTSVQPVVVLLILLGALAFLGSPARRRDPRARRAWAHGLLWAGIGTLISLTPVVRFLDKDVSLPQRLVAEWFPLYARLRVPGRLGVAGLMGLALLAGLAFAECTRWIAVRTRRASLARSVSLVLALVIALTIYGQYSRDLGVSSTIRTRPLPSSYPLQEAIDGDSPLVRLLAAPGGPLLELPTGSPERFFASDARAMYRSIFHWRPLLNGYSGYWPAAFPDRMWAAAELPDPEAVAELRSGTGLEMILVHSGSMKPEQRDQWLALAASGERADLHLVARDGNDLLFSVTPAGGAEAAVGAAVGQ